LAHLGALVMTRKPARRLPGWIRLATAGLVVSLLGCSGWSFLSIFRRGRAWAAEGGTTSTAAALKEELVKRCDAFKAKQEEMWDFMEEHPEEEKKSKKSKKDKASLLEAESFAAQRVELSDDLQQLREKCIEAIEELGEMNPTARPTSGWRGYGGETPGNCVLNGTWKLLFTDAADATFRRGKRGSAKTFQEIDAEQGWFINCVDFSNEKSKLQGFRVFVEGRVLSDNEIELIFRKVRLLRRSRFFPEITIPLPGPGFLRAVGRLFARSKGGKVNESNRGAGFKLLYVDGDLRIHRTFDGLYFVQRRLQ